MWLTSLILIASLSVYGSIKPPTVYYNPEPGLHVAPIVLKDGAPHYAQDGPPQYTQLYVYGKDYTTHNIGKPEPDNHTPRTYVTNVITRPAKLPLEKHILYPQFSTYKLNLQPIGPDERFNRDKQRPLVARDVKKQVSHIGTHILPAYSPAIIHGHPQVIHTHKVAPPSLQAYEAASDHVTMEHPTVQSVLVIDVNAKNGGTFDPNSAWLVDCNKDAYKITLSITAIWDDDNNFSDLDKVKCKSIPGVKLDIHDAVAVEMLTKSEDPVLFNCPPDYVLTGVFDTYFGFPSTSFGKCTKLKHGSLDNYKHKTLYTDKLTGGPYDAGYAWKVECPAKYVAIGIKKTYDGIVALNCAHVQPRHG